MIAIWKRVRVEVTVFVWFAGGALTVYRALIERGWIPPTWCECGP